MKAVPKPSMGRREYLAALRAALLPKVRAVESELKQNHRRGKDDYPGYSFEHHPRRNA